MPEMDGLEPVLLEHGKSATICAASRGIRGIPDKGREEVLMKRLIVGLAATGLLVTPMSLNSLSAQQTDPPADLQDVRRHLSPGH
jgi:hypothetical protein